MEPHIIIRACQEADYPALMAIEHRIWTLDNSPVIHRYSSVEEYKQRTIKDRIFVALVNNQIAGFVSVHPPTPMPSHQKQWVLGIGIDPQVQSLGLGTKLLDYVKQAASAAGIAKLSLRVMGSNPRAIAFYQCNGFIQEGLLQKEFWLKDHFVDDYLFAYML